jgi:hypothetical protein
MSYQQYRSFRVICHLEICVVTDVIRGYRVVKDFLKMCDEI